MNAEKGGGAESVPKKGFIKSNRKASIKKLSFYPSVNINPLLKLNVKAKRKMREFMQWDEGNALMIMMMFA
jgi:hypothetical protein